MVFGSMCIDDIALKLITCWVKNTLAQLHFGQNIHTILVLGQVSFLLAFVGLITVIILVYEIFITYLSIAKMIYLIWLKWRYKTKTGFTKKNQVELPCSLAIIVIRSLQKTSWITLIDSVGLPVPIGITNIRIWCCF